MLFRVRIERDTGLPSKGRDCKDDLKLFTGLLNDLKKIETRNHEYKETDSINSVESSHISHHCFLVITVRKLI